MTVEFKEDLNSYLLKERQIDKLAETDISIRIDRPINPHFESWQHAIQKIDNLLHGYSIVGFHCSRLSEQEASDILRRGLRPLDPAFTEFRIRELHQQGMLSLTATKAIIGNNEASAPNRKGNLCFFHCLSILKNELGLYRLFRSWGGEAIYCHHEEDSPICHELRKIGIPHIIMGSLHLSDTCNFSYGLEERIVHLWLDRDISDSRSRDCDTFVNHSVSVLEIIPKTDIRFEELTNCSRWDNAI